MKRSFFSPRRVQKRRNARDLFFHFDNQWSFVYCMSNTERIARSLLFVKPNFFGRIITRAGFLSWIAWHFISSNHAVVWWFLFVDTWFCHIVSTWKNSKRYEVNPRRNRWLPGPGVRCKSSSKPPRLLRPVIVNMGACFFTLWTVLPNIPGRPYALGAEEKELHMNFSRIISRWSYQVCYQAHNFYGVFRMYKQVVIQRQFSLVRTLRVYTHRVLRKKEGNRMANDQMIFPYQERDHLWDHHVEHRVNIVVFHPFPYVRFLDWENSMGQVMLRLCTFHAEDRMNKMVVWNEPNVDRENYCQPNQAEDKRDPVWHSSPKWAHVVSFRWKPSCSNFV